jgi:hypothetical protein
LRGVKVPAETAPSGSGRLQRRAGGGGLEVHLRSLECLDGHGKTLKLGHGRVIMLDVDGHVSIDLGDTPKNSVQ